MTRVSTGLLLALLCVTPSFPQDESGQKNTALVRVYPNVEAITSDLERFTKDGKWADALKVLWDAMKSHPNHLVPIRSSPDDKSTPIQFLGVTEYVRGLITKWVAENEDARTAVRAYFDPFARAAFEAARSVADRRGLSDVVEQYPFSSYADDALMLRGQLEFDGGEVARAVDTFELLLSWKDADVPLALIYARLGQAYGRAGRKEQLATLVKRAEREAGNETVRAGGKDVPLPELLKAELKRVAGGTSPTLEPSAGWELFQGSPDGARVVEETDLGQYAWKAPLELARFSEGDDRFQYSRGGGVPSTYRPFYPAVSDGIVYVHGEYSAAAYNLFGSGEQLWIHRERVPAGDLMYDDRVMHATTVADGRAYANLVTWLDEFETQHSFITVKFPFPKRQLVCLDAYTGKVIWRMGGKRRAARFEDGLTFSAPPTPYGGLLYVTGIKQDHQTDPFEHHLLCIDPEAPEGKRVLWSTFVASGGTEINLFGNSTRESTTSPVAVTDDSVYLCTNHGAVGCADRRSGRLRWIAKYQQLPVNPTRSVNVRRNPPEWTPSAPVVACGTVCVAPCDSPVLYGLDARTGRRLWERGRARDVRSIFGVSGTKLVVGGDAIEWYDLAAQGKLADRFVPMQGGKGMGRGLVAADGVYLPTTEGIHKVRTGKGRPESTFHRWPGRTDGGNLIAADGALLVASLDEVVAFYDRKDVERQIREELEKDPNNAWLNYRAALRLLQSGKAEGASDLLVKVVKLASKSARAADERLERAARKRLYGISIAAAREAMASKSFDAATSLYRRARDASPDTTSVLAATLGLAEALGARKEHAAAIAEYQKLLEQRSDDAAVFDAARSGISELIRTSGREVYRETEREAEKMLALGDGVALFRRYPNSIAAEKALIASAAAAKDAEAAGLYRLYLQYFPESERVPEAQAALVQSLERQGLFAAASVVLRKMAKGPAAQVKDGARTVSVKEFVDVRLAKDAYKLASAGAAPPLQPPLKKLGGYSDKEFADGAPLRVQGPAFARAPFVFVGYRGVVKAVDLEKGAAAWSIETDGPVRAAFSYDDALVLCTGGSIVRVNPASGAVEWRYTHRTLMNGFGLAAGAVCFLAPDARNELNGQISAVDATKGALLWTSNHDGSGVARLLEFGDLVVFVTEGPYRVYGFEVESGRRVLAAGMTFASGNVDVLGIAGDQLVLHFPNRAIEAYGLPGGAVKWRRSLEGLELRAVDTSAAGTVFLAERIGQDWQREIVAYLIDHKTGKIAKMKERPDVDEPLDVKMDVDRVFVSSRTQDGSVRVRALSLADFSETWKADFGTTLGRIGGVTRAGSHLLVVGGERLEGGTFNYRAVLLDRQGARVQDFKGDGTYERPPGWTVTGGAVVFSVDNRIEVWK